MIKTSEEIAKEFCKGSTRLVSESGVAFYERLLATIKNARAGDLNYLRGKFKDRQEMGTPVYGAENQAAYDTWGEAMRELNDIPL